MSKRVLYLTFFLTQSVELKLCNLKITMRLTFFQTLAITEKKEGHFIPQ